MIMEVIRKLKIKRIHRLRCYECKKALRVHEVTICRACAGTDVKSKQSKRDKT